MIRIYYFLYDHSLTPPVDALEGLSQPVEGKLENKIARSLFQSWFSPGRPGRSSEARPGAVLIDPRGPGPVLRCFAV